MQTEALVERLAADLAPVRRRRVAAEAAVLVFLAAAELAAFLGLGFARPDMPTAMELPAFWWKLVGTGLIAVIGFTVAVLSMNPVRSPRRGLAGMAACIAAVFVTGWPVDGTQPGFADLLARLDWVHGLQCVQMVVLLAIPPVAAFAILVRRGAPTDRAGTVLAAALGSAAWGAFVFVFACPYDDPLYIAVWYTVSCTIVTGVARLLLLGLSRW